ncbi:PIR protein CIR protein [Plasmodium vinckei brucechwatti]|uniref:PIR protein CIR protein n=1 Tax=Plasmodium vinckei brucechwatti TaxID=119398 RepID=A0A6V7SKF4_PLAVN|nr:PIR protein CIR protein [Plasmodium vinckei brucechwatti]
MSHHVCEMFNSLYSQLPDDDNEEMRRSGRNLLYETYCPKIEENYQKCNSDHDRIKAGFIYLIEQLFGNVNSDGEHEDQKSRYVYYGFLWMSYKLQQSNIKSSQPIDLYNFLNKHIVNGDWYDVVEEYVKPKISMITKEADISLMSDIYYILKEMCKSFSNNDGNLDHFEDFSKYYEYVKRCGENISKKNSNNTDTDNIDEIYVDLYDMLKNVYNEYRNYHNVKNTQGNAPPELPDIKEIQKKITHDLKTSDSQDRADGSLEPQDGDGNSKQQQPEPAPLETPPPSSEEPTGGKREPSSPPAQESSQPQPQIQDSPQSQGPSLETDQRNPAIPPEDPPNEQVTQESIEKIINSMKLIIHYFKPDFSSVYNTLTEFGNDVYENVLNGLKGSYSIFMNFVSNVKDSIDQLDNEKDTSQPGDNGPKLEDPGDGAPPSDGPSENLPPSPSSEQPPKIEHSDPQDPKDEDKKEQYGEENPVDKNQEKETEELPPIPQEPTINSINTASYQIPNSDDSGSNRNEIVSKGVFSVIVIAIPVILAIMYKYLYYRCGKKSKRKKNMKKVINSVGGKRQVQIIISSSNQKKQTKKSINSFNEKKSLLNIYKLMQADPVPFINLFFLLIFFVYKRTHDTIEL